jgi:hypothetical protein
MKNLKTILLLMLLMSNQLFAQQFAEFTTDTSRINDHMRERISKELWYMNGQEMHYDGKTIQIKVNPDKFDTIVYYRQNNKTYDTVLCNIKASNKYTLSYNECCGFFYIKSKTTKINNSVLFRLENKDEKHIYLGSTGMTGILVNENNTEAIFDFCRSAMASPLTYVSLHEVEECNLEIDMHMEDCDIDICLWPKNGYESLEFEDETYGQYIRKSRKMGMAWIGLNSDPLIVVYDPATNKITYE